MTLKRLIDAVEAKTALEVSRTAVAFYEENASAWDRKKVDWYDVLKAYNGSLDAAKRLHDALLPGWGWAIEADSAACVWHPDTFGRSRDIHLADTPARAWLIALLRALEEGRRNG